MEWLTRMDPLDTFLSSIVEIVLCESRQESDSCVRSVTLRAQQGGSMARITFYFNGKELLFYDINLFSINLKNKSCFKKANLYLGEFFGNILEKIVDKVALKINLFFSIIVLDHGTATSVFASKLFGNLFQIQTE